MLYIGGFMDNTSHLIYGILTHFISGINTVVICNHIISYHLIELRVNNVLSFKMMLRCATLGIRHPSLARPMWHTSFKK